MTDSSDNTSSHGASDELALSARVDVSRERMRALQNRALPPEQLAANTALVASRAVASAGKTKSILVFRVGDERLALEAHHAHRVVPVSTVRRVPHRTNEVFAGIANILGELTVVARIGAALGVGAGATQSQFIVIGGAADRWAFAADSVEGVRRISESSLLAPPTTVRHAIDGCAVNLIELAVDSDGASVSDASQNLVTSLDPARLAARFQESIGGGSAL